jgi:hypothetical protein
MSSRPTTAGGSRAIRLGSRHGRLLTACFVLALVVGLASYWAASLATHSTASSADSKYGGLPSWLPKATVPVGRVLQASAARPQLGIEGDSIVVHVGSAEVTTTAVGPQVPEEGQFPVPATTLCTFDVTLANAHGTISLRPQDFTTVDELGGLHSLKVALLGGGRMPAQIRSGQTLTLVMSAVLPTGNGTLRWSPGATQPVASWDFAVEID